MGVFGNRVLGCTGLVAGPLGMSASYGAPAASFEEAFERVCNYFYYGAVRRGGMRRALKNLIGQGFRDRLIVVIQSFTRWPWLLEPSLANALKNLGTDHADILLLGYHNAGPAAGLMEKAARLQEKGLFRFLGISTHNRGLVAPLAAQGRMDVFHVRYNAAHRGAEQDVFPMLPQNNPPGIVAFTGLCWGHLLNAKKMPPDMNPATPADCYRFCLSHPGVHVCVTGPKTALHVREALKALDLGPLTDSEMERMRRMGDHVHGRHGGFF